MHTIKAWCFLGMHIFNSKKNFLFSEGLIKHVNIIGTKILSNKIIVKSLLLSIRRKKSFEIGDGFIFNFILCLEKQLSEVIILLMVLFLRC